MQLKNKRILILSGPTHEYFDPVRFIGNASSGKMGKALAEEALRIGMKVEFITGPVSDKNIPVSVSGEDNDLAIQIKRVISAEDMLAAAQKKFKTADLIIFAAAVADFQPLEKSDKKGPKTNGNITLELKPTPDIAATLCKKKRNNQLTIGFALQTHEGETKAKEKLIKKSLNGIVLNTPATLGAENGLFTWIDSKNVTHWGSLSKIDCAKHIFAEIACIH